MSDWYIARNGVKRGPVLERDLQELVARGELRQTDMVWTEGQAQWQPASILEGIDWSVAPPHPPPPIHPVAASYPRQSGKAVTSMVFSILGFLFCPVIFHILGLVLGYGARNEIARSSGALTGEGMATAGIAMGWIGLGLALAGVILYVLFFGMLFVSSAAVI